MGYSSHENKKLALSLESKVLKTLKNLELPRYEQAERAIIGLLLYSEEVQKYCFERLKLYHFYDLDCRTVFRTMAMMYKKGLSISIYTVYENNKDLLPSALIDFTHIAESMPRDITVSKLVEILVSTKLQRDIIQLNNRMMYLAGKDLAVVDSQQLIKTYQTGMERIISGYEASIDKDLTQLKYDQLTDIKTFNPILSVYSEIKHEYMSICEHGGMIGVIGAKGSRKTYTFKDLAVTLLGGQSNIGFQSHYKETPVILWVDTEQRERTFNLMCNEVSRRIYEAYGDDKGYIIMKDNFHAYRLASKKRHERLRVFKSLIRKYKPQIAFLDGVVDMVGNYNDQEESRAFVDDLMEYRDEYKFTLIYVLHTAKSTGQSRGHLGTELDNKVEVVMKTTICEDPQYTKLECVKNRETMRFDPVEFQQVKGVNSYLNASADIQQQETILDNEIPF